MSEEAWTLEQATELAMELFVDLLDGCEDDDTIRPALIYEAIREVWAPTHARDWDPTITAAQVRAGMRNGRARLAAGERIP